MKREESGSKNIDKLLKLIAEHPNLPIIPMVRPEVNEDRYSADAKGSWGNSCVERVWEGQDGIYYYDPDYIDEDALEDPAIGRETSTMTPEEARKTYDALPWKECIVVYIVK